MAKSRYYHPDYRQAEVSSIVQALDRGQSVSVIGAPSVGKTNLLRFLDQQRLSDGDRDDPWLRYAPLSASEGRLVAVNVDPNALLPALPQSQGDIAARAWPGFELLVHRMTITSALYPALYADHQGDEDLVDRIGRLQERYESAHPDVTDFEDHLHAHLALRHLEGVIDATLMAHDLQGAPVRIAFFMDEFERLLETMPNYFFVALRSLRDRFKYRVMFVTFTRNSLPYLAGTRMPVLEPFLELFNDNTIYLGPFADDDAWRMVEQLEQRAVSKDDYALGLMIRAAGGFAGLLRAGFAHAEKLGQIQGQDYRQAIALASNRLTAEDNVQAECQTLLRALSNSEIALLYAVSEGRTDLEPSLLRELMHKALLRQRSDAQGIMINPPVLAAYIRKHPTPPDARPPAPPPTLPES